MGEGIFLVKEGYITYGFYNINNNTFQCTHSVHYDFAGKFCDGTALMCHNLVHPMPERSVVHLDDLQEDRDNLVLEEVDWNGHYDLIQYGSRWVDESDNYAADLEGREIPLFTELSKDYEISFGEDGYVFARNGASFFVIDPEGNRLYEPQPIGELSIEYLSEGYCYATRPDDSSESVGMGSGIVDREGSFHSFGEDLSGLPYIDEVTGSIMAIGGSYLLATGPMFGLDNVYTVIRSLAGENTATHVTITEDSVLLGDEAKEPVEADLSGAIPVTWAEDELACMKASGELAGTEEAANMGTDGTILVDAFANVRLFDRDGVTVTLTDFDTLETTNHNPDNLQAEITNVRQFINGVDLDASVGFNVVPPTECPAGETIEYHRSAGTMDMYYGKLSELSPALAEVPPQEVTWQFCLRIGSDAEPVRYSRTLRLNSYSEAALTPLYGDCVGQYTANGKTLELYRIHDEDSIIAGVRNLSDEDVSMDFMNGYWYWTANGEKLDDSYPDLDIPSGSMQLLQLRETEQSLRAQLEIPDGEPLAVGLVLRTDDGFDLDAVLEKY